MHPITIRNIRTIVTAPRGINLVVVKVETSESGLYGLGCATFTWRYKAVVTAVEEYLKPMFTGRSVHDIEDIWQSAMGSSYWRNGPVLNNALSGLDEALWDIKGKLAGMPLYSLFGGKCREGVAVYKQVEGTTVEEVEESIQAFMEQGYRYIRCQRGMYGGNGNSTFGDGYVYINDVTGIGVDIDEKAAAKYPPVDMNFNWLFSRLEDGTAVRP